MVGKKFSFCALSFFVYFADIDVSKMSIVKYTTLVPKQISKVVGTSFMPLKNMNKQTMNASHTGRIAIPDPKL